LLKRLFHEKSAGIDAQAVRFAGTCSEIELQACLSIQRAILKQMTTDGRGSPQIVNSVAAHYDLDPKTVGFEAGSIQWQTDHLPIYRTALGENWMSRR